MIDLKYYLRRVAVYAGGVAGLSRHDVLLCSFPKAGNTWVRMFLYSLLSELDSGGAVADADLTFDLLDSEMPEFGANNLLSTWRFSSSPRLIKTHLRNNFLFRKNRSVLILRHPLDLMVSYYHYVRSAKRGRFNGNLKDFLYSAEYGIEQYFKHYESWKDRSGLVVRYEDLKSDPLSNFKLVLEFCGVHGYDDSSVLRALDASSMSNVRKAQKVSVAIKLKHNSEYQFARKGISGEWQHEFDDESVAYAKKIACDYSYDAHVI